MSTKQVDGVKVVPNGDGTFRLVRKKTYRAKNKKLAADREAKAWIKKSAKQ